MARMRRLVPKGKSGEFFIYRIRKISDRESRARRRELLAAGYLESEVYPLFKTGEERDWASEISRLDNDYEAGLLSLTLRELKRLPVLRGRRNHVKHIMKSKGFDREKARRQAREDFWHWGGKIGKADDYINYYYEQFG